MELGCDDRESQIEIRVFKCMLYPCPLLLSAPPGGGLFRVLGSRHVCLSLCLCFFFFFFFVFVPLDDVDAGVLPCDEAAAEPLMLGWKVFRLDCRWTDGYWEQLLPR